MLKKSILVKHPGTLGWSPFKPVFFNFGNFPGKSTTVGDYLFMIPLKYKIIVLIKIAFQLSKLVLIKVV